MTAAAVDFEERHVHSVYEAIASHFSATRYKPWPLIARFLDTLPLSSIGADCGCGNGKYLSLRAGSLIMLGTDRSQGLLDIAAERGHDAVRADCLSLPFRDDSIDFAISIATIHHFATEERRLAAIEEMLRVLDKRHGKLFIQVWAKEQKDEKQLYRSSGAQEKRLQTADDEAVLSSAGADVFVPWHLDVAQNKSDQAEARVYRRFYHLFEDGELSDLVQRAITSSKVDAQIDEAGWERGNWYAIATIKAC
ncbi:uncharacterized protein L969DRAFT_54381 [Mixia osmundae IAM 14324]|uniref:Methyltransferase type 11 domain-containing protein n=1 Tax=Mixia osmundae (strain CBS 9802 / IAM 14324 / JCM 22182 / KY 12970) TaxID=764103 RepID=G7E1H8_MIXOS|nr:uncharacterized protein L969DRAFT_54381 [Mixia osmundae IAM 14324]KEI36642.1 hypothetical protein L969DRAFT_54381 [Mixia osmundae IAM 14324]GAA96688.1 hypothetical protein E5Q_03359 [Mixia osmundae IAM 14324]